MTIFIRVLEAAVDVKAAHLKAAVNAIRDKRAPAGNSRQIVFECDPEQFSDVPGSPFAYWISEAVRSSFHRLAPFESDSRSAAVGLQTSDDFRFVRAWWEIAQAGMGKRWYPFAKGGEYSPYYSDVFLCVNWESDGSEVYAFDKAFPRNEKYYFRPGLTWPLRTTSGFGVRLMPAACIFGHKGPAAFVDRNSSDVLLGLCAILNSQAFRYMVGVQLAAADAAARSYEVGLIQQTPVPDLSSADTRALAALARRAWSLKRALDTLKETSHAFVLPPGLNERITGLDRAAIEAELAQIQGQIDDRAFGLNGIGSEDRALIELARRTAAKSADGTAEASDDEEDVDTDIETLDAGEQAAVTSWLVGVAFGRFDPRLATGERAVPPEPQPFEPLPIRSPGMCPEGKAPRDAPDILVYDEGHGADLTARVRQIAERVHWQPPENLRAWLGREFFPVHIKMYSRSRRRAPIYWQLATPSGSYSVWLYLHALTKDTLFRVQHEYAGPKLLHEEQRLELLRREFGDNPSRTEREQMAEHASLVSELRAFLGEVKCVASLWKPDLDDGVVINFAPLWRLVPHCTSWQRELKSTWEALCEGKYDWAHLAMHLWPERVVAKCAQHRSLAIAHGLEGVFWAEDSEGKWVTRESPTRSIAELVRERTSPTVKAALESLRQAPVAQSGGRSRARRAPATGDV